MKKMTHRLAAAFAVATLLAACGPKGGGAQQAGAAPPPAEVDVITVSVGPVLLTDELPGRMEAYRTAQVRARVEGIVDKRLFTEGSDVRKGDTLFRIDAPTYRAVYASANNDREVARQTFERYARLRDEGMVSKQDFDLVEARLRQTEAALSRAQIDMENTHVPAPISGRIGRAQVTEGALVGRGDATLLATIEQVDPIYANFTRPGAELHQLQQAFKSGALKRPQSAQVELVLEDGSNYAKPGKLLFSNLAVDPGTGSVTLRAEFPNPAHELLPGMFVRIRFPTGVAENSIRIPQRAVQIGAQGQFVLVVDHDNKVAARPVKTGEMVEGDFIVSEGLQAGDTVIVNGVQKARPGMPVKPVPLEQAAPQAPAAAAKQ